MAVRRKPVSTQKDDDPWDRPLNPPDGETHASGKWVYAYHEDGEWKGRTLWRWKRNDGTYYYKGTGCAIFVAAGLVGLAGGVFALFV
jgi:hypothetical protein